MEIFLKPKTIESNKKRTLDLDETNLYWPKNWHIGTSSDVQESHFNLQPIFFESDSLIQLVKLYDGSELQRLKNLFTKPFLGVIIIYL